MLEIEKRKEVPMLKGEDNFGRGRREAHEGRDATLRRARIEAASASAVRDRLEKGSPSSARRNFAGMLNELVRDAAGRELPGLAALAEIRKGQKYGYKTAADHNRAHERFEKTERFNRLHPDSFRRASRFDHTDSSRAMTLLRTRGMPALEEEAVTYPGHKYRYLTFRGKTLTLSQWARKKGIECLARFMIVLKAGCNVATL